MSRDVAIDLGTSTTQVVEQGRGFVVEEPTVVAVHRRTGEVTDVGRGAVFLAERDPDAIELIWPVRCGAVDDPVAVQRLFARLLRQFSGGISNRLRVVVSVSSCTTPNERRAVRDAAKRAGASSVQLIEHVVAAALGADLPIHEPVGTFILDIGAGATEAALLSLGCVVKSSGIRSGSAAVDLAIKGVLRRQYGVVITDRTAEDIKLAVGNVPGGDDTLIEARGQLAIDGSTMTAILEKSEVQSVVDAYVERSVEAVRSCLTGVSPELSQDVVARGMYLVGGGALLGGLPERLAAEFSLPVHVMDDPDHAVVTGAAKCLEDQESLRRLFIGIDS